MKKQQRRIHFKGHVQGVGFRFATVRTAEGYDVTGYVKNLPDGGVEVIAEGTTAEIDAFLAELRQRMSGYIREVTQQAAPPSGRYDIFGVKH